jgi:plastocyanin
MLFRHRPVGRSRTRTRTLRVAALGLAASLAVVTVGDAATTHTAAVGAGGDDRMRPPSGTVVQGDTVEFRWEDGGHDMVLGGPDGTRVSEQDEDFVLARKLDRAGQYSFACTLHDDMTATFDVQPAPGGAPEPQAPAAVDVVIGSDGSGGPEPAAVTVVTGQPVNFHWGDNEQRTVSFDDGQAAGSGSIGDAFFTRSFSSPGEYSYNGGEGRVTVLKAGAGGVDGIRPAPAGTTPNARVTVGPGNSFAPNAVTIDEGGVVEWTWAGGPHNVKFADGTDSRFRSSGSLAQKFYKPGSFGYVCTAHSGMSGTVTVNDIGPAGQNEQAPEVEEQPRGDDDDAGGADDGDAGGTSAGGDGSSSSGGGPTAQAAAADGTRPALSGLRARLRAGRRAHRLQVTATEDAMLRVRMQRLGRSRDLMRQRSFRLYAREGANALRLPVMRLTAGRYRLRIVAVDRAGNRSAARTMTVRVLG